MVQRHDIALFEGGMEPSKDGGWVSYDDYEKLNSLVQELAAAVDMSKLSHRDREQLRELGYL